MSAKQTLPDQHLLLHERWPSDCCLCHHEGAITRLTAENERLRGLVEEVGRLREAVWAVQEWWRVSRDEIWNERKGCIEFILGRVKQCIFCKKSLGPQENKDSQGDGWWGCWPPCEPREEALGGKESE